MQIKLIEWCTSRFCLLAKACTPQINKIDNIMLCHSLDQRMRMDFDRMYILNCLDMCTFKSIEVRFKFKRLALRIICAFILLEIVADLYFKILLFLAKILNYSNLDPIKILETYQLCERYITEIDRRCSAVKLKQ